MCASVPAPDRRFGGDRENETLAPPPKPPVALRHGRGPAAVVARRLRLRRSFTGAPRFEDEHLRGDVGIDVMVAEKRDHLTPGVLDDGGDEILAHRLLEAPAHVDDRGRVPVVDEDALTLQKGVAQDDQDMALGDRRIRLRRPATGVVAQQPDDRIADRLRCFAAMTRCFLTRHGYGPSLVSTARGSGRLSDRETLFVHLRHRIPPKSPSVCRPEVSGGRRSCEP